MAEGSLGGATVRIKIDIPALKKDLKNAERQVKVTQKRLNKALGGGGDDAGRKVGSKFSKGFARSLTNFISQGGKGGMASIGAEGGAALLGGMSVAILAGAAVVIAAVAVVAKVAFESLKSFIETEKKLIRLQAVFRSTGQSAGFSAEQIKRFAHELAAISLTPDNEILEAAAIIATFQNIVGENFKKAIIVSNDLAIAMGTNQKSAALQLAKALAQPITGLQSLREIGILFTDEQKDMIVEMNRAGKTAEAMNEVFKILAKNGIDGNSKATDTLSGQVVQLGNAYEQLKSSIGELLAASGGLADQLKGMVVILRLLGDTSRVAADGIKDFRDEFAELEKMARSGSNMKEIFNRDLESIGNIFEKFWKRRQKGIEDLNSAEGSAVQKTISMMDAQLQHSLNSLAKLESAEKSIAAVRKRRGAQALLEDDLNVKLGIESAEKRVTKERALMKDAEKNRDDARKAATKDERAGAKIIDDEIKRLDELIKKEKEKEAVKRSISFGGTEDKFASVNQAVMDDANQRDEDDKKARIKALEGQKELAQEARKALREQSILLRERADAELEAIRKAHDLRLELNQKRLKALKEEMRKLVKLFMEEFDLNLVRDLVVDTSETAASEVGRTAKPLLFLTKRNIQDGRIVEDEVSKKNRENAARALNVSGQRLLDLNKKLKERGIGSDEVQKEGERLLRMGAEAGRRPGIVDPSAAGKVQQEKQLTQGDVMIGVLKTIAKKIVPFGGVFGGN